MGKKGYAQRKLEQQVGRFEPPEHAPADPMDSDPMAVLANIKKQQLIEYYAGKYGLSPFLLSTMWEYLEKCTPQKIKQIKRGQVKNILKRETYEEGQVINKSVVKNVTPQIENEVIASSFVEVESVE